MTTTDLHASLRAQLDAEQINLAERFSAATDEVERARLRAELGERLREGIALDAAHRGEPPMPIESPRVARAYAEHLEREHAELAAEHRAIRDQLVAASLSAIEGEEPHAELMAELAGRRGQLMARIEINDAMQVEARRLSALLSAHDEAEAA